jgi:hypothetical protein
MSRQQSRDQRLAAVLNLATNLHAQWEAWYDQHPGASFGEIEAEARRLRREFMIAGLAVLINGRDTGFQLEPPVCPHCAQPMQVVGYRPWRVSGLEGETELERAYYVCRGCEEQTLFPSGSDTELAGGSLEGGGGPRGDARGAARAVLCVSGRELSGGGRWEPVAR